MLIGRMLMKLIWLMLDVFQMVRGMRSCKLLGIS
ncbi:hypothetical protein Golob_002500 [Gossypium lobatum]|uniref:Uncharacterized protein n=1 Tax=Gossypium lobatum TaxID=34289 RepID=A0A7J8N5A9_9ROSI|nr:hypothetical protein [Gossypium lobatum]